jgi:hypothetical protein
MNEPNWTNLGGKLIISAKPSGLWTRTDIFVLGPALLKFEAAGQWYYSTKYGRESSADGDLLSPIPLKRCLSEKAPIGSLLGKIGGSVADRGGDSVFLVGSYCVLEVGKDQRGPLYLTINDVYDGYIDNDGQLEVVVQIAPSLNP